MEKRRLLILTQTVSLTSLTLLATLTATGLVRVWHVFVIAFVGGSSMAFKGPARTALVNDLVEPHHLLNAIALNSTGINITRMLGPALGGILLANLGIAATFYCGAVFLAIAMVNLIMLRVTSKPVMHRPSIWGQVVEGLRYVSQNEIVFTLIGLITIPTLFGMPYQTLLPVFARDVLQVGETGLGWLSACTGVGAVTGSLTLAFLGNYRKRGKMLLGCAIAFGAALICFSLSAGLLPSLFVLSLLLMTLVGFANMTYTTTTNTLLQTMSPPELRGRVMSLYMLSFGLTPLGALPVGAAAGRVGAPLAVGLSGAICLLFVLLVAVKRRKLWRIA